MRKQGIDIASENRFVFYPKEQVERHRLGIVVILALIHLVFLNELKKAGRGSTCSYVWHNWVF